MKPFSVFVLSSFFSCLVCCRCVSKLCDPKLATQVEIPDLMICAPWTPEVFSCLADGKDHSPCCRARGIPAPCYDLCTGNITKLDYHYFKWVHIYTEYNRNLSCSNRFIYTYIMHSFTHVLDVKSLLYIHNHYPFCFTRKMLIHPIFFLFFFSQNKLTFPIAYLSDNPFCFSLLYQLYLKTEINNE